MKILFTTKDNIAEKRELISLMLSLLINKKNNQIKVTNEIPYKENEKDEEVWILDSKKEWSIKFIDNDCFEISYDNYSLSKKEVQGVMKKLAREVSLILDIESLGFNLNENEDINESIG